MTPDHIRNHKNEMKCFWCQSALGNFPNAKFLVVTDDNGQAICLVRAGNHTPSPLVYCSSDCMVYDSHLRYCDRIRRGVFRKSFDLEYGGDTHRFITKPGTPTSWQEEGDQLINGTR